MNVEGKLFRILLTAIVVLIPGLLAVHLVEAITLPLRIAEQNRMEAVAAKGESVLPNSGLSASLVKVAANQSATAKSLVAGILYTKGKAVIDWNGVKIPMRDGSYAYVGGEIIAMAADAIGLLKLADGSSVHICPGSKVRLSRNAAGEFSLKLISGASRFKFRADKAFQVNVNDVVMTSGVSQRSAGASDFVTAEVHAKEKSGCIVCALNSKLNVSTRSKNGDKSNTTSTAGDILNVTTDQSQSPSMLKTPIPADIMSGLTPAAAGGNGQNNAYLCRCQEIQRYAEDLAEANAAIAAAEIVDAPEVAPVEEPVASTEVAPPSPAPELAPPVAPPVALAVPGAPDPFDPNVLPPPAAGGPADSVLVVAPPARPSTGSGGGLPASPS